MHELARRAGKVGEGGPETTSQNLHQKVVNEASQVRFIQEELYPATNFDHLLGALKM